MVLVPFYGNDFTAHLADYWVLFNVIFMNPKTLPDNGFHEMLLAKQKPMAHKSFPSLKNVN